MSEPRQPPPAQQHSRPPAAAPAAAAAQPSPPMAQPQPKPVQTITSGVRAFDVLVGDRDNNFANHPGNYHFSEAIKQMLPRYMAGMVEERNTILQLIMRGVRERRGRFMKLKKIVATTTPNTAANGGDNNAGATAGTTTTTTPETTTTTTSETTEGSSSKNSNDSASAATETATTTASETAKGSNAKDTDAATSTTTSETQNSKDTTSMTAKRTTTAAPGTTEGSNTKGSAGATASTKTSETKNNSKDSMSLTTEMTTTTASETAKEGITEENDTETSTTTPKTKGGGNKDSTSTAAVTAAKATPEAAEGSNNIDIEDNRSMTAARATTATSETAGGDNAEATSATTETGKGVDTNDNKNNEGMVAATETQWAVLTPVELTEFLKDVITVLTKPIRELNIQPVKPLRPDEALSTHDVVFGADQNYAGNGQMLAIAHHEKMQEMAAAQQQRRPIDENSLCYSIYYAIHCKGGQFYTWAMETNKVFPISGSPEYLYYGYDRELKRRINWVLRTGTTTHPPTTLFPPPLVPPPRPRQQQSNKQQPKAKKAKTEKAKPEVGVNRGNKLTEEISPPPGNVEGDKPWPPGWVRQTYARQTVNDHRGYDHYYISPAGNKFRSMPEVRSYLAVLEETGIDEDRAFPLWKDQHARRKRKVRRVSVERKEPPSAAPAVANAAPRTEALNLVTGAGGTQSQESSTKEQAKEPVVIETRVEARETADSAQTNIEVERSHLSHLENNAADGTVEGTYARKQESDDLRFTPKERECVVEGMELHGGSWTQIKKHYEEVLKHRSTGHISDFWRYHTKLLVESKDGELHPWTTEERRFILEGIERFGVGDWSKTKQQFEKELGDQSLHQIKEFWSAFAKPRITLGMTTGPVPFTKEERRCIQEGIRLFGVGQWTKIKEHFGDSLKNRTPRGLRKFWKRQKPDQHHTDEPVVVAETRKEAQETTNSVETVVGGEQVQEATNAANGASEATHARQHGSKNHRRFTVKERECVVEGVELHGGSWSKIKKHYEEGLKHRSTQHISDFWRYHIKVLVGSDDEELFPWTTEERHYIFEGIERFGVDKWSELKLQFDEQLCNQSEDQIKEFWSEVARPRIISGLPTAGMPFTEEERQCIEEGLSMFGAGQWTKIKGHFRDTLKNRTPKSLHKFWSTVTKPQNESGLSTVGMRFTEEERRCIQEGINLFGVGQWSKIKEYFGDSLKNRTAPGLRDYWKRVSKTNEKAEDPADPPSQQQRQKPVQHHPDSGKKAVSAHTSTQSEPQKPAPNDAAGERMSRSAQLQQQQPARHYPAYSSNGASPPAYYWQGQHMVPPYQYPYGAQMMNNPQPLKGLPPSKKVKFSKELQILAEKFGDRAALVSEIERLERIVDNALVDEDVKVIEKGVAAEGQLSKLQKLLEYKKFAPSRKRKN